MIRIFTGPSMIAQGLISELNEVGIQPVLRNDHQSGTIAGFGGGIPDQVILFVREDQLDQAKPVIENYLSSLEE